MEPKSTRRAGERGAALVEFALVIPILSMFLFGIVQFGIAYDKQQSVNSAAREGARLAALDSSSLVDIATRAVQAYSASASPGADPVVTVYDAAGTVAGVRSASGAYTPSGTASTDPLRMPCGRPAASTYARVVVSTPYDITIPFLRVQRVTIDAQGEFRCE